MKLKKIFSKITNFIYKDTRDKDGLSRYRSLFGVIATRYTIIESKKIIKEYIFLNCVLIKRVDFDKIQTWYFLGCKIWQNELINNYKQKFKHIIDNSYDDVYFFNCNSGEAYIFMKYMFEYYSKIYNSKKPLFITNIKYNKDIVNLFYPDLECKVKTLNFPIFDKNFYIDGKRYTNIAPIWYFKELDKLISTSPIGKCNYFDELSKFYGIKYENNTPKNIKLAPEIKNSALKKAEKIGLNLDNFILIIPEAKTCGSIGDEFWIILINELRHLGYDVFVNTVDKKINAKYKYTFLTFKEMLALAYMAKQIISIRCGLSELLSESNKKMHILYTGFKYRRVLDSMDSKHVMSAFSFYNLPHIKRELIKEYDTENISNEKLISLILKELN